jgi:MFS family permease
MEQPPFPPAIRKAAMLEAGFSAAWAALAGGVFLAGFAVELQASNIAQGFLASLPFLAGTAQIIGAYFVEAKGYHRRTVALSGLIGSRLLFLGVLPAAILLLPGNPATMLGTYMLLASFAYLLQSFANVAWLSWMGDLVPEGQRGGFFASRNFMAGLVTMLATAFGGQVASIQFGAQFPPLTGYLIVFAVAGILGLFGAKSLSGIKRDPLPPTPATLRTPFWSSLREPLRKQGFRRFLLFHLCWMSGVYLSSPFFQFYYLQDLKLDIGYVALTNTVATLAGLTSIQMWGKLCDRYGSKPVLYITLSFAATIPLVYVFTNRENVYWLAMVVNAMSGSMWAGISLAAANLLLKLAPKEKNSVYLSTFGALSGLATASAPIISGIVSEFAKDWSVEVLGVKLYHFKFMFVASFVVRASSILLLLRIREEGERTASEVVRALSTWRTLWSVSGAELLHTYFFLPLRKRIFRERQSDARPQELQ